MGVLRFFSSSACCRDLNKSALAVLRRKTGFTFANIRKALELHNNDATKAEEWLKEQAKSMGWSAAAKLQNRQTSQGLIGVALENKKVAMVEVNCETDFVSRNSQFKSLVELITTTCLKFPVLTSGMDTNEVFLKTEDLEKLKSNDNETLENHLAVAIGSLGENMILKRAFCFETVREDINVAIGIHPFTNGSKVLLGRYGSFISFERTNPEASLSIKMTSQDIGRELCKHVIGMNPSKIGDFEKDKSSNDPDNETVMIHQEFLYDQTLTVGEFLIDSGTKILNFKRFECGEIENLEIKENVEENICAGST